MNEKQIPLTPAEQMQRIRNAVLAAETPKDAEAILAACLSQLDTLRDHIADLEGEMALQEQPFVSRAPLIGPAIVWFRSLWNWMSTKWYVLPLVAQQNAFNEKRLAMPMYRHPFDDILYDVKKAEEI